MKKVFKKLKERYYQWNLRRINKIVLKGDISELVTLVLNKYNIKVSLSNGMTGVLHKEYICQGIDRSNQLKHCVKGNIFDGRKNIKVYFVKIDNRYEILLRQRSNNIDYHDVIYINKVISYTK